MGQKEHMQDIDIVWGGHINRCLGRFQGCQIIMSSQDELGAQKVFCFPNPDSLLLTPSYSGYWATEQSQQCLGASLGGTCHVFPRWSRFSPPVLAASGVLERSQQVLLRAEGKSSMNLGCPSGRTCSRKSLLHAGGVTSSFLYAPAKPRNPLLSAGGREIGKRLEHFQEARK